MKRNDGTPAMRAEYDFSSGIRGKHYRRYRESTNVVVLAPDVQQRFKNSEAVNKALRALMRRETAQARRSKRPTRSRVRSARR